MEERFLVTGALGCIGAWAVKRLVDAGVPVWTYDLPGDPHRLRLILGPEKLAQVNMISGDLTDFDAFEHAVADNGITHVVQLAALQVPFVRANPVQGARVNVVGTTIVLETIRRHKDHVRGLAYASSVAVYGPPEMYPGGVLRQDSPFYPVNLYGVQKQADEGTARLYWQDWGVASIGLRPYVVYGPGRDQGMTSTPTKAMLAAAAGRPYRISYGGTVVFQHADDTAASFIHAARNAHDGCPVYNLGGTAESMDSVVKWIEEAAPEMAGKITNAPEALALAPYVDDSAVTAALGTLAWRPMRDGVRDTITTFRAAVKAGAINVDRILAG